MKTLFVFVLALLLNSAAIVASETANNITISGQQQQALGIQTAKLQAVKQHVLFKAPAVVEVPPRNAVIINTPQAGFVQQLQVAEGESVDKDQILAVLNSPDLVTLQNDYLQAYSQLQLSKNTYQRDQQLYQQGIISERRWQQTRTRYNALKSSLHQTRSMLEIAGFSKADLSRLQRKRQLEGELTIKAPIAGVILERNVDVGQKVEMLEALFHLADLKQLWLSIRVPQEQVETLRIGDQVAGKNQHVSARVSLIHRGVDPHDQTVKVRAVIDRGADMLRVGQQLTVSLMRVTDGRLNRISSSAIIRHEGNSCIFEQTETGFQAKPVNVVSQQGNDVVITGDLNPSAAYATAGVISLKAAWLGLGGDE